MTVARPGAPSSASNPFADTSVQRLRNIAEAAAALLDDPSPMLRQTGRRIRDIALSTLLEVTPDDAQVTREALAYEQVPDVAW